jgi:dTDP-D-glucose 4,6-dehydratase
MNFRGSTIFVTGGAGFIGSAVIRHMLDDTEAFIVNIDKLTYASNLHSIPQATAERTFWPSKISATARLSARCSKNISRAR